MDKIWNSNKLADFRKRILRNKKEIAICREYQYNEKTKKEIKIQVVAWI